jgi:hypothetical protein
MASKKRETAFYDLSLEVIVGLLQLVEPTELLSANIVNDDEGRPKTLRVVIRGWTFGEEKLDDTNTSATQVPPPRGA